jgi:hypothetical protein
LCMRTWKLWQLALDNQMLLKAAHIAWKKNILADRLNRFKVQPCSKIEYCWIWMKNVWFWLM